MVETRLQKSRRIAKEAQESVNMSSYEYDNDLFYNPEHTTLPDMNVYRHNPNVESANTINNNATHNDTVDNSSILSTDIQESIMDLQFNRLVEEIMRRDRQYFLNMMAQSGAKIPHDFDLSQLMESRPSQQAQPNMDQRRPNSGGNRGPNNMMPESPSVLLQKPTTSHTQAQTYDTYTQGPSWRPYAQSHAQGIDPSRQVDTQRHPQNFDTRRPHVKIGGNTMENERPIEYGLYTQNRYGVPQQEVMPSAPYMSQQYRPPYGHVYDQYHPYMQQAPPQMGVSNMGYATRNQSPPKNNLEQQIRDLQKKVEDMGTSKPTYTMRDICPYPFDKSIPMPPFPPHFVTPKFDKYRGRGDPKAHIRQFFTACIEVAAEETYLMRLFP